MNYWKNPITKIVILLTLTTAPALIFVGKVSADVIEYIPSEPVEITDNAQLETTTLAVDVSEVIEIEDPLPLPYTDTDIEVLSKMVWGEARGCTAEEQALCIWTVLNRLADGRFGDSIEAIVKAPYQFAGYNQANPVTDEIQAVVINALEAWTAGEDAPVLEPYAVDGNYLYFTGGTDGLHNWFRGVY